MSRRTPGHDRSLPEPVPLAAFTGAMTAALAHPLPPARALRDRGPRPRRRPHVALVPPAPVGSEPEAAVPDASATALWAAYRRAPGAATRDPLVMHYTPLVRAVAHRIAGRLPAHLDPADLVQSGMFGLLDAIERFDPARAARFESYAGPRIRGAILDEIRTQDWVPRAVRLRAREAERVRDRLTAHARRTVTDREVADDLGVAHREVAWGGAAQLLGFEALREGADGAVLDAFASDAPAGGDPAAVVLDREARRQLWLAVAQLDPRDRLVVRLYYLENRTLAEIGRLIGVTESRVCQLHSRLVGRLRVRLEQMAAG
jgi:RNA polymerase sigma factor for flagellar operon FliA